MNLRRALHLFALCAAAIHVVSADAQASDGAANPWLQLMEKAAAHAKQHGAPVPLLSPVDRTVLQTAGAQGSGGVPPQVPVAELQARGIRVVPWTTNEPETMRAVIRFGVDGLISDRPDLLQKVLAEERAARPDDAKLKHFVVSAHRGGRGLRPENTLPSFESGLDQLANELETDTGVSTDHVSLIWHDQYYNPQSCRRADGAPYTNENRIYLSDISSADAQKTLICDRVHFGPEQRNDLSLSPVSVAFAKREGMPSPYAPTYVAQLFRFTAFYADYYSTGAGKNLPEAGARAANARRVRFNIETKILPDRPAGKTGGLAAPQAMPANHTVSPQVFVDTLAGVIAKQGMQSRCGIQSFDFRTLQLVEEQFPAIPTYYLTENPRMLSSEFVPADLRATP